MSETLHKKLERICLINFDDPQAALPDLRRIIEGFSTLQKFRDAEPAQSARRRTRRVLDQALALRYAIEDLPAATKAQLLESMFRHGVGQADLEATLDALREAAENALAALTDAPAGRPRDDLGRSLVRQLGGLFQKHSREDESAQRDFINDCMRALGRPEIRSLPDH